MFSKGISDGQIFDVDNQNSKLIKPPMNKSKSTMNDDFQTQYIQINNELKIRDKELSDLNKTYNSLKDKLKKKTRLNNQLKQQYNELYDINSSLVEKILIALSKSD